MQKNLRKSKKRKRGKMGKYKMKKEKNRRQILLLSMKRKRNLKCRQRKNKMRRKSIKISKNIKKNYKLALDVDKNPTGFIMKEIKQAEKMVISNKKKEMNEDLSRLDKIFQNLKMSYAI